MKAYLSLIKFSHTLFALPFAFLSFFLAIRYTGQSIDWILFVKVIICMVAARSAAMAFNRYADRAIDASNVRTAMREIPAGIVTAEQALLLTIGMSLLFVITTYFINHTVFFLSPVALMVILGYSYAKRFTWLCHFVLGLGLGFAPLGAYVAVADQFHTLPVLYGVMVLLWVAGFDILYALQDEEFDKANHLHSIPQRFGKKMAKRISIGLHMICAILLIGITVYQTQLLSTLNWIQWIGVAGFIILLIWQHRLVFLYDLQKINAAFGETNGIASVLFGCAVILDVLT